MYLKLARLSSIILLGIATVFTLLYMQDTHQKEASVSKEILGDEGGTEAQSKRVQMVVNLLLESSKTALTPESVSSQRIGKLFY